MAKAKGKARGKAAARRASLTVSNERLSTRREAVRTLNAMVRELELPDTALLPRRTFDNEAVEKLVKTLERRCTSDAQTDRVRAVAQKWQRNGGRFSAEVVEVCDTPILPKHRILKPYFRLQSKAFMLTFNGRSITPETWPSFDVWVQERAQRYGARAWAACLEESLHAAVPAAAPGALGDGPQRRHHLHAYFFWTDDLGVDHKTLDAWVFQEMKPRVDVCRSRGAAVGGGQREAALHGLWYVHLDKSGTVRRPGAGVPPVQIPCKSTNYYPWRDYIPKAAWLVGQYNAHKLSHDKFIELSAKFRTGHEHRKRDAEAALAYERKHAVRRHVAAELAELQIEDPVLPARSFDEVTAFLDNFARAKWRRPILAIVGGTNLGKSFLARDVLRQLAEKLGVPGFMEVTVQNDTEPSLEDFDHRDHAGVLFDGVGDALFLNVHREVFQGQAKETKGGRSATMKFAYPYTLCRRGVVATFDLSAKNLDAFQTDHWLADCRNVIVLNLTAEAWTRPAEQ